MTPSHTRSHKIFVNVWGLPAQPVRPQKTIGLSAFRPHALTEISIVGSTDIVVQQVLECEDALKTKYDYPMSIPLVNSKDNWAQSEALFRVAQTGLIMPPLFITQ